MQTPTSDPGNFTPSTERDIGGNLAGRLFGVVRTLQKNRELLSGIQRPSIPAQNVAGGDEVMSALFKNKQNEQKQNAPTAS
jgi:hypothetical protein